MNPQHFRFLITQGDGNSAAMLTQYRRQYPCTVAFVHDGRGNPVCLISLDQMAVDQGYSADRLAQLFSSWVGKPYSLTGNAQFASWVCPRMDAPQWISSKAQDLLDQGEDLREATPYYVPDPIRSV